MRVSATGTYEYIDCVSNTEVLWIRTNQYELTFEADDFRDAVVRTGLSVPLDFGNLSPGSELTVKFLPPLGRLRAFREEKLDPTLLDNHVVPLHSFIDLDHLSWLWETGADFRYPLELVLRSSMPLQALHAEGLVQVSVCEEDCLRYFVIQNRSLKMSPVVVKSYRQIIGNLDREIIGDITMFVGARAESWQIKVDGIHQPFQSQGLIQRIQQALSQQAVSVPNRVPLFFRETYHESSHNPLEVTVTIPEMLPDENYTISVALRNPISTLYHETGNREIDRCLQEALDAILDSGVSSEDAVTCQRVLRELLVYRHSCGSVPDYIHATVAQNNEIEGFHRHLHDKLATQLNTRLLRVISEPEIGNSRVDLLIEDIPTELKLEDRRTATTDDIVNRYRAQAADYVGRQSSRFGFLLVLDIVLDRDLPASRVDQDFRVDKVPNVSGDTVTVIALVIRIPRPASEHTIVARHRRPSLST